MSDSNKIEQLNRGGSLDKRTDELIKKLEKYSGKPVNLTSHRGIVYLLIDCSSSMLMGDKIQQATSGSSDFAALAQAHGYTVGLISFGTTAEVLLNPTDELGKFNASIEQLVVHGSTNMTEAIQRAVDNLVNVSGERIICIVTDGQPDNRLTAINIAKEAKNMGIDIMTIGTDDADKAFLDQIASRKELSRKVERHMLKEGITSMAKLLPGK